MSELSPETREAIRRRAEQLIAQAPTPTDEQITVLRRWFAPRRNQPRRQDAA